MAFKVLHAVRLKCKTGRKKNVAGKNKKKNTKIQNEKRAKCSNVSVPIGPKIVRTKVSGFLAPVRAYDKLFMRILFRNFHCLTESP